MTAADPSRSTMAVYRWIAAVLGRRITPVVLLCALQSLMAANAVCYALFMKHAVDAATARDARRFTLVVAAFALAMLAQIAMGALTRAFNERARASIDNALRGRVFDALLHGDYATVSSKHTGELMNRLTSDVTVVSDGVVALPANACSMAIRIVGVVMVMWALQPMLTVVFLIAGLGLAGASTAMRGLVKRLHHRVQEAEGRVRSYMQEALASLIVVQVFGAQRTMEREGERLMDGHRRARIRRSNVSNAASTGMSFGLQAGYLIGFAWCGWGIVQGTLSVGTLMAVVQLVGQIQRPFSSMGGMVQRHASMLASAERLIALMPDGGDDSRDHAHAAAAGSPAAAEDAVAPLPRLTGLRFDDVWFSYGDRPVLRGFDLDIRPGEFIALTGESGIGKSTLLRLMVGACRPERGTVTATVESGGVESRVDVRDLPQGMFAYVPQGNMLMGGTIAQAVAFAHDDADVDMERVRRACRAADATGFVEALPDGYATMLGERGRGLSEGQMQRIAVARALYADAPVILFDEATSALDERTETHMLDNIRALRDRTVVMVTHRRATLDYCDRTVELAAGDPDV
ncbi:ABC transporter ATP-binding protein [Bifidobacterium samirii]|uniref:Multidrug ABC transporter permease component n=1 Tax=Bifidobacterium samirii TaxID=2306974 RepID=A0A430FUZ7_9BIFI|nr:ABC transporter ATP-binding protein [Bifidobacterium samirii]RSX57269.1 multidrug ABC transporter permease component [Bifidobacterium samirii]